MCSTDVLFKTTKRSTENHHPSFSSFLELGRRKLSMQPKFVAAQKMLLKRNQQTFVNGLLGFLLLWAFILRWKRVCIAHNNCMSCPSIWATLSALLINILQVPSSCFCIVISLSEGEIIPFSVCQSGGGCIIHAGGMVASRTD